MRAISSCLRFFIIFDPTQNHQVKRAEGAHEAEVSKIMQENVTLIKEINDLRKELKAARSHARKVEGTLKTSQTLSQMRNESITMDLGNQSGMSIIWVLHMRYLMLGYLGYDLYCVGDELR